MGQTVQSSARPRLTTWRVVDGATPDPLLPRCNRAARAGGTLPKRSNTQVVRSRHLQSDERIGGETCVATCPPVFGCAPLGYPIPVGPGCLGIGA
jgi:hypothetical protein